jgi:oligopeptide transport system substrate-binding protein
VLAGWGADYDDPLTYGDLMASWNENNRGRYSSAEYDHWVSVAQQTPDAQQRLQAFAAMQQLLHDDVPVLMSYENAELYLQHPQLQGVTRNIFGGDPNYRYARVMPLSEQAK